MLTGQYDMHAYTYISSLSSNRSSASANSLMFSSGGIKSTARMHTHTHTHTYTYTYKYANSGGQGFSTGGRGSNGFL